MTREQGFTLVEVLSVLAIIAILANIAIPLVQMAIWRAHAAAVINDFVFFRQSAMEYVRDHGKYPPNGTRARPARDFEPYLDGRVRWSNPHPGVDYYIWENWEKKGHGKRLGIMYGFSVKAADDRLITAIQRIYDGRFEKTVYNKYTFVMAPFEN